MINIGNKIRELRKNKGITQEQLASALNYSPQAISKWEMNVGYPDIATLPVIAAYFGVSLDALFDYDPKNIEEEIQKILFKSRVDIHGWEETVKYLRDGIAAYPSGYILKLELLDHYTWHLTDKGIDLTEEALDLAKQIVAECPDSFISLTAMESMANIYIQIGEYEKGKDIIQSMPYHYHLDICDKMRSTVKLLNSNDSLHEAREWKRWAHQELCIVCNSEAKCFYDIGDYENALYSYQEASETLEYFLRRQIPKEYSLLQGKVSQGLITVSIAACLYKLGRINECDTALDKAYHLIRGCFNDDTWKKCKELRMKEFRNLYNKMGLDEYKSCAY